MSDDTIEISFTNPSKLGLGDLQTAAKAAWSDLQTAGTQANARALAAGIDVAALPPNMAAVMQFKPAAAGVGGVEALLIGLAPVAWDLWKHVLLPHIRDKFGDDAIKAKRAAAKAAAKKAASKPEK